MSSATVNPFTTRGTVKRLLKLQSKLRVSSSVTSQLFTLEVRFWAHLKAKSLSFHFRVHKFAFCASVARAPYNPKAAVGSSPPKMS